MNRYPLRLSSPRRTCVKSFSNYRSFKKYLRKDFRNRCGYCDDLDSWSGGTSSYHIDHFAPKKFTELISRYSNLVYSCPFCNNGKGDDWVTQKSDEPHNGAIGYIDPCNKDYEKNFYRDADGRIEPTSDIAKYMHRKLHLYLERHAICWSLTLLRQVIPRLKEIVIKNPNEKDIKLLLDALRDYQDDYLSLFHGDIPF